MTISLCMIVKNEEASLARCLNSVKDIVKEMVIIDTGSTDRTQEIIREFGANLDHFQWNNNFAVARNYGLQYVTGDWVLSLDADEVLTPEIVPHIQTMIQQPENLVINFIRQEVGAIQSPYSLISRLFRRHPQIYFTRPYHSMIDDSVSEVIAKEPDWKIVELPLVGIRHYGYQPEAIASLDKYTRARKIMEGYYQSHPNDAYVCSKLGALYIQIGEVNKGVNLLQHALNCQPTEAHILFELHYHLGNAYTRLEQIELALEHYQQALAQPILPKLKLGAYNNLGSLVQTLGDLNTALQIYTSAIEIDSSFDLGYYNLGMTLKAMGKYTEAIAAYQQGIQLNPDYAYTYQNLGVVYLKIGQLEQSLEAFKKAIALHQTQNNQTEAERLRQGLKSLSLFC